MIVSLCTVCKNRAHHYKQTILKNIADNSNAKNVEFLLLDYNSDDDLEDWVKGNLMEHIESGLLSYYKTVDPLYFHRSHSRNMAFRLAKGELICNVDADNYTGPDFATYLQQEFSDDHDVFVCAGGEKDSISCSDIGGRICIRNQDFWSLGGYDEEMCNYGFEDYDLINRLDLTGLKRKLIRNTDYLQVINHEHIDRITEEFPFKNIKSVKIHQVDPMVSKLLLLFNNDTFAFATLVNEPGVFINNNLHEMISLAEEQWITGDLKHRADDQWSMISNQDTWHNYTLKQDHDTYYLANDDGGLPFYNLHDPELIEEAIFFYSKMHNKMKMEINKKQKIVKPNHLPIGVGVVYKNFDYDNPIVL